jgi:hypothetical protein
MPFLDEIANRIVTQGAGVLGTNLFLSTKSTIPSGDGPYTSLVEYGGTTSRRTQNHTATQRPSAQIVVRAKTYQSARSQCVLVHNALGGDCGLYNTVINGTFYQMIIANQQIFDLSPDELGRARVGFNIDVEKNIS